MKAFLGSMVVLVSVGLAAAAEPRAAGLRPGEEVSAWEPVHVAGPHAGTKTCPVCTYLEAPVLLAFAKDAKVAARLVPTLEGIGAAHAAGKLKVMLVVVDGTTEELTALAKAASVRRVMLCLPDAEKKAKQLKAYKVDSLGTSSLILCQDYTVKKAWADVTAGDLADVKKAADAHLPRR